MPLLFTGGANKFTPSEIRDYINTPGRTAAEIYDAAVENEVSVDNIRSAMAGRNNAQGKNFNSEMDKFLDNNGIYAPTDSYNSPKAPTPTNVNVTTSTPSKNFNALKSTNTKAKQDPIKGTVAGQLNKVIDPNSQLMVSARNRALSNANKSGLLNSSLAATAGEKALIDTGLQIATPDALANNRFAEINANSANQTSQFNAGQGNQVGMFGVDQNNRVGMFNADQNNRIGMFNSSLQSDVDKFNVGIDQSLITSREANELSKYQSDLQARNNALVAQFQLLGVNNKIAGDLMGTARNLLNDIALNDKISGQAQADAVSDVLDLTQGAFDALLTVDEIDIEDTLKFGVGSKPDLSGGFGSSDTQSEGIGSVIPGIDSLELENALTFTGDGSSVSNSFNSGIDSIRDRLDEDNQDRITFQGGNSDLGFGVNNNGFPISAGTAQVAKKLEEYGIRLHTENILAPNEMEQMVRKLLPDRYDQLTRFGGRLNPSVSTGQSLVDRENIKNKLMAEALIDGGIVEKPSKPDWLTSGWKTIRPPIDMVAAPGTTLMSPL